MIVRTSKESRERYLTIDITASRDPRLSLRAVGLHTWLMTMADNWEIRMPWICQQRSEGREALQGAFQELKRAGYAEMQMVQADGSGKAMGNQWTIYETSRQPEKPANGKTVERENRPTENRPEYIKKDQEERTIKDTRKIKSPPTPKGEEVFLILEQEVAETKSIEELAKQHREEAEAKTQEMIDRLYKAYPKKVGRAAAIKAIRAAMKKAHPEAILAEVEKFALSRRGQDANFTPHPATWFNQERWNDTMNPTTDDSTPRHPWLW